MNSTSVGQSKLTERRLYVAPMLVPYGTVRDLTQAGSGATTEASNPCNNSPTKKTTPGCPSERRLKENIAKIGTHPAGFSLYLFDYKAEYRDRFGHGRQFGVMIDEVEKMHPHAVCIGSDGFKRVDLDMIGIERHLN